MDLLIENLEQRIEAGYVNYDSLLELLKLVGETIENNPNAFSRIEQIIIMAMIRDINREKDLTSSIANQGWENFSKVNQEHLYDEETKAILKQVKEQFKRKDWDTLDIIYLTLIVKKNLIKIKEMEALNFETMKNVYDYIEIIGSFITHEKKEIENKQTFQVVSKVKRKKACNS